MSTEANSLTLHLQMKFSPGLDFDVIDFRVCLFMSLDFPGEFILDFKDFKQWRKSISVTAMI